MNSAARSENAFRKLLTFRILIVLAYQIMGIVVGWHIYELTHDTLALGLIGLAEVIPYFCCALFAGYAVDHYSRRMFGVVASLLLFLNALTLAAVFVPVAFMKGIIGRFVIEAILDLFGEWPIIQRHRGNTSWPSLFSVRR